MSEMKETNPSQMFCIEGMTINCRERERERKPLIETRERERKEAPY
jgi:hypothetical protein